MSALWRPSAMIETLKARADLLMQLRQFFAQKMVLEVDTPAMSQASITDIHLHPFCTHFVGPGWAQGLTLYLQTSPEFHMKRLLAAGSGAIYQITKAFRNEEAGRNHNPEFTMLEWYRPDFDHHDLMGEMDELLQQTLRCDQAERLTYQQAFLQWLGFCPLDASLEQLKQHAALAGFADLAAQETNRDTLLQLLFSHLIEPQIGQERPAFVYDFPASQAALAQVSTTDPRVAARFEVYFKGIELANGFFELQDAAEQLARFEQDNAQRLAAGLTPMPIDQHLIAALEHGLPSCAGVALGVDRLLMLMLGKSHLAQVLAFDVERA